MTARMARLAGLGAALAASAVTIAGCGPTSSTTGSGSTPGKTAATTASKTPTEALTDSVPDAKTDIYHFTVKGDETPTTGVIDMPKKSYDYAATISETDPKFTMSMSVRVVSAKAWTKISFTPANLAGLPRLPKKWLLIDESKLKDKDSILPTGGDDESDPGNAMEVFENASALKETSAGHYSGTVDLTKTNVDDIVSDAQLKAWGAKAKTAPFTAVLDAKGRLSSLIVKLPAGGKYKAGIYSVTYDQYGTATSPVAPSAAEQTKAPAVVYDMLNS